MDSSRTRRTVFALVGLLAASLLAPAAGGLSASCTPWRARVGCEIGAELNLLVALGPPFPLHLPVAPHNYCVGFPGPMEDEPNDASILANGPLCFDYLYTGSPVDDLPGAEEDWFSFDWDGAGTVEIDVEDFLADAQVLLYFETGASDFIARDYAQPDGHYEVICGPTCSLGRSGNYLIRVFAPEDRPTTPTLYNLRVTLLP